MSDKKQNAFYEAHIGKPAEVLFEHTRKGGKMYGFTENYIKTEISYRSQLANTVCHVTLGGWNADKTALTVVDNDID